MRIKLAPPVDLSSDAGPTIGVSSPLGLVRATFSRFGVVDADGDVTVPGAIPDGLEVPISSYGHGSWSGALPIGKGVIHSDQHTAWIEGQLFLATTHGRDAWQTIHDLGSLCQWSYGFTVPADGADMGPAPDGSGKQVQFLRQLTIHEVSPVLVGAGVGVTTDSVKADVLREYVRFQQLARGPVERDSDAARDLATREHLKFIRRQLAPI